MALASGHAALVTAITAIMGAGSHIVSGSTLYGGTVNLLSNTLPGLGINTTMVSTDDPQKIENAIRDNTRLVLVETIGNPASNLCDIDAIAAICKKHGIPLLVDSTFSTPYLYQPFEHGANIVLHSATKFLGGHGTTMGGILVDGGNFDWKNGKFPLLSEPDPGYHDAIHADLFGKAAFIGRARVAILRDMGACLSPFNAFLLIQGIETLSLRVERHVENTRALIKYLSANDAVSYINYPELPGSPYKVLADRDYPKGVGSIFTFGLKGGKEAGAKFLNAVKLFRIVANVADVRSMVIHPATTTHSQLTPEQLKAGGIDEDMVRVSVGTEHIDDIIADFDQAIRAAQK